MGWAFIGELETLEKSWCSEELPMASTVSISIKIDLSATKKPNLFLCSCSKECLIFLTLSKLTSKF